MNFPYKLLRNDGGKACFLNLEQLLQCVQNKRLVYFGEFHSEKRIIELQLRVLKAMSGQQKVHVVAEHFSFEMQNLLRKYQDMQEFTFEDMIYSYQNDFGTEGHDLKPYKALFEYSKLNRDRLELHGGFVPRPLAGRLKKITDQEEREEYFSELSKLQYLPQSQELLKRCFHKPFETLKASKLHYNMFESLLSGRDPYEIDSPPKQDYGALFQAQLIKDYTMGWYLSKLFQEKAFTNEKFLVIAGKGHLQHYLGVPEVVANLLDNETQIDRNDMLMIIPQMMWEIEIDEQREKQESQKLEELIVENELVRKSMLLNETTIECGYTEPIGDVMYIYDEDDYSTPESTKSETVEAYDKVGETAHIKGNAERARAILSFLGYSEDDQKIAGDDIYNYQGVGNPFYHAKIQPGERVLDLGSGLGIDSFIAAHHAGHTGEVVGVDISKAEIIHARRRKEERKLNNVSFVQGDIENLSDALDMEGYFDVAISNGAFCLLPNKEKAFKQVYCALKPGGRISICTTTLRRKLDKSIDWPLCIRMFYELDKLHPLLEGIGFVHVNIDQSSPEMEYELPEDVISEGTEVGRFKVHGDSEAYRHLEGIDMNELCARVTVTAEKP